MSRSPPTTGSDRGQTNVDFVVGIALFLGIVIFVLGFLPTLTAPYQDQEASIVVDRAADTVAGPLLGAPSSPSALDEECAIAFFENESGGASCSFEPAPIEAQLGIESTYAVNVTLEARAPPSGNDSEVDSLNRGPPVPTDSRSVASASRAVTLDDGSSAVIEVRVW